MVLRRWGSCTQEFGFVNGVDNVNYCAIYVPCFYKVTVTSFSLKLPLNGRIPYVILFVVVAL